MADRNGVGAESAFVSTCWTDVLSAKAGSPGAEQSLTNLYKEYWPPLLAYVRRRGFTLSEAEDITQEFFVTLIEKDRLARIKREGGRFRSFLLTSMQNFLANNWQRSRAAKRGGGALVLSLDEQSAEPLIKSAEDEAPPEVLYDREWALHLLQRASEIVEGEYSVAQKASLFSALRPLLQGDRSGRPYPEIAEELGMAETAVRVAVHRMRHRYGEVVREEIRRTVSSAGEVQEELRHLLRIVSR